MNLKKVALSVSAVALMFGITACSEDVGKQPQVKVDSSKTKPTEKESTNDKATPDVQELEGEAAEQLAAFKGIVAQLLENEQFLQKVNLAPEPNEDMDEWQSSRKDSFGGGTSHADRFIDVPVVGADEPSVSISHSHASGNVKIEMTYVSADENHTFKFDYETESYSMMKEVTRDAMDQAFVGDVEKIVDAVIAWRKEHGDLPSLSKTESGMELSSGFGADKEVPARAIPDVEPRDHSGAIMFYGDEITMAFSDVDGSEAEYDQGEWKYSILVPLSNTSK